MPNVAEREGTRSESARTTKARREFLAFGVVAVVRHVFGKQLEQPYTLNREPERIVSERKLARLVKLVR